MADVLTPRPDPVFERLTPLLFAHRGGALEAPENTLAAFRHAKRVGADVLELDVQSIPSTPGSHERKLVVWHGPSLYNVRLERSARNRLGANASIENASWSDLEGSRVAPHGWPPHRLGELPNDPEARIIGLEELLADDELGEFPLNIEMKKETFDDGDDTINRVHQLLDLLREKAGDRRILLASQSEALLDIVERDEFATSLSIKGWWALAVHVRAPEPNRVLQAPWWPLAAPRRLLRRLREHGSGCHVFITAPAGFDRGHDEPERGNIFRLLDRGVDGVMTDRPSRVRGLIDEWRKERGHA